LDRADAWHSLAGFLGSFARHAGVLSSFDFGISATSGRPAIAELGDRLPLTLIVLSAGTIIALVVGGPLGILFGGGPVRRAAAPLIQFVAASPVFCAALALNFLASSLLHWPQPPPPDLSAPNAFHFDHADPFTALRPLLLPALTVGAAGAA